MSDSNSIANRKSPEDVSEDNNGSVSIRLVEACIAGDHSAMQQLYERCSDRVYRLMMRMVGPQDADDLTQQVFLQTFRKLDRFRGESTLETWLYRLASNEALQHLRRRKRDRTDTLLHEPASNDSDRGLRIEDAEMLELGLSKLDAELRVILSLKEVQDLSYAEIAETIGIPAGTVGSRLNRARKELRQELTKLGWNG